MRLILIVISHISNHYRGNLNITITKWVRKLVPILLTVHFKNIKNILPQSLKQNVNGQIYTGACKKIFEIYQISIQATIYCQ